MVRTDCPEATAAAEGLTINSYVWQIGHQEFVEFVFLNTKLRTRVETMITFSFFIRVPLHLKALFAHLNGRRFVSLFRAS